MECVHPAWKRGRSSLRDARCRRGRPGEQLLHSRKGPPLQGRRFISQFCGFDDLLMHLSFDWLVETGDR